MKTENREADDSAEEGVVTIADAEAFLIAKNEVRFVDLAVHLLLDPEETRALIAPLLAAKRVEQTWRPLKSKMRDLCDCEQEEVLRWLGH